MADEPGPGKAFARWRLPQGLPSGPFAAYLLVIGLTAACAGLVYFLVDRPPPLIEEAVAAAPAVSQTRPVSSLKLPFRRPRPLEFRMLTLAERDDMVEVTPDGLRLPKISFDGWMPWIAYARRYDPSGPAARVGLLMINVGADEALMMRVIDELPGEVSLAFLPGTPDLSRWMKRAHAHNHETYLMMPVEDPEGIGERGIRAISPKVDGAENVKRLQETMTRGEGYVGFVMPTPGPVSQSEEIARPIVKEIADRGLGLIEINPGPTPTAMYRLATELGVGYARTSTVLDYKLARNGLDGNLDRLAEWTGETWPGRPARHDFGVLQPDDDAIDAIVAWRQRLAHQSAVSLVPIIGHFECRSVCMERLHRQPDQLRP
ncbi:MAG TPA: divergent polysaccharide deacetylase family protein [Reyranella sp.]|nr:divergent polysaccharide deacetylase family protein [Reyranella sp.]